MTHYQWVTVRVFVTNLFNIFTYFLLNVLKFSGVLQISVSHAKFCCIEEYVFKDILQFDNVHMT